MSMNPSACDFVKKLYKILADPTVAHIIAWTPQGDRFVVKDVNELTKSILPRVFKHSNFASFVRQLNKYDFHKVRSVDDDGEDVGDQNWIFHHPQFHSNAKGNLENIKRKVPAARKHAKAPLHTTGGGVAAVSLRHSSDLLISPAHGRQGSPSSHSISDSVSDPSQHHKDATVHWQAQLSTLQSQLSSLQTQLASLAASNTTLSTQLRTLTESQASLVTECASLRQEVDTLRRQNSSSSSLLGGPAPSMGLEMSSISPIASGGSEFNFHMPVDGGDLSCTSSSIPNSSASSSSASPVAFTGGDIWDVGLSWMQEEQQRDVAPVSTGLIPPASSSPLMLGLNTDSWKSSKSPALGWTVPPHVLVVDDDIVSRKLGSKFLQVCGCTTDVAVDGMGAVAKMNLEKYDLVLMDIMMPKMDGMAAATMIRKFDMFTPIISMTSNPAPGQILSFYSSGMNDILSKPVTKASLAEVLEKHLIHLKNIQQQMSFMPIPMGLSFPLLENSSESSSSIMELPPASSSQRQSVIEFPSRMDSMGGATIQDLELFKFEDSQSNVLGKRNEMENTELEMPRKLKRGRFQ